MGSISDSLAYDMNAICESGDVGTLVTYSPSVSGLPGDTHVIIATRTVEAGDGYTRSDVLTAVIFFNDVANPHAGDTFVNNVTLTTYNVLEIIERETAHVLAIIEEDT